MDKDKILDYVMNSPENTNRAVLSSMLDSMSSGGGNDESIFIIKGLYSGNTISNPSKTFEEMLEAYNSGKLLVFRYLNIPEEYGNQASWLYLDKYYQYDTDEDYFAFKNVSVDISANNQDIVIEQRTITCNRLNQWTSTLFHKAAYGVTY